MPYTGLLCANKYAQIEPLAVFFHLFPLVPGHGSVGAQEIPFAVYLAPSLGHICIGINPVGNTVCRNPLIGSLGPVILHIVPSIAVLYPALG